MDRSWRLGYSACGRIPEFVQEHALDELRRATANLAAIGWPGDGTEGYGAVADPATTAEVVRLT